MCHVDGLSFHTKSRNSLSQIASLELKTLVVINKLNLFKQNVAEVKYEWELYLLSPMRLHGM
jgi:hypothetical protein